MLLLYSSHFLMWKKAQHSQIVLWILLAIVAVVGLRSLQEMPLHCTGHGKGKETLAKKTFSNKQRNC